MSREQYRKILEPHLGHGFELSELVSRFPFSPRHGLPASYLYQNMVPTLMHANNLRALAVERCGATGLRVAAAYRPYGGAKSSAHKTNEALDLDIIGGNQLRWYREAVSYWVTAVRDGQAIGLGLYCPNGWTQGIRVHIDTRRSRSWQHSGGRSIRCPGLTGGKAQRMICSLLGLEYPL